MTGAISTITNSGMIGTINNSGTVAEIYNSDSGSIGTINNSGKVGTINNSGKITNVDNISSGSIGTINNANTIGNINTGKSTSNINNTGAISSMVIGADSTVNVKNTGIISSVYISSVGMWFYDTHQSAVAEWASQYAPMSDDVEYGAMIYRTGLGFGTYYFMGETYKGFKTKNWYTVVNGLIAGASVGLVAEKVATFSSVDLEMMGFAHTHPIGHTNTPSGPDVTMKDIGAFLGYGLFPIAVYNRATGTVSINYF